MLITTEHEPGHPQLETVGLHAKQILVATAYRDDHQELSSILEKCGVDPTWTSSVAESYTHLAEGKISLVLCDEEIVGGDYAMMLDQVGCLAPGIPVAIFSRLADWERYLKAMRAGAFDYFLVPCRAAEVEAILNRALRWRETVVAEFKSNGYVNSQPTLFETRIRR